jgi:hypothetical protein
MSPRDELGAIGDALEVLELVVRPSLEERALLSAPEEC